MSVYFIGCAMLTHFDWSHLGDRDFSGFKIWAFLEIVSLPTELLVGSGSSSSYVCFLVLFEGGSRVVLLLTLVVCVRGVLCVLACLADRCLFGIVRFLSESRII